MADRDALQADFESILSAVEALRGSGEGDDDQDASSRLRELQALRARAEALATADELTDAGWSSEEADDVDERITALILDIELIASDEDLIDSLGPLALADCLADDAIGKASRPVGEEMRNQLDAFIQTAVPGREVDGALDELALDLDDSDMDDEEEAQAEEASEELGLDYLMHDWRWVEGQDVPSRYLAHAANLTEEERRALRVLASSYYDLYRVDDVDVDRAILHLERATDNSPLDVEVEEDLVQHLGPGDGVIARIYPWSDGPELGAFLPVDGHYMPQVEAWLEELFSDEETDDRELTTRSAVLKVRGYSLIAEMLEEIVSADALDDESVADSSDELDADDVESDDLDTDDLDTDDLDTDDLDTDDGESA